MSGRPAPPALGLGGLLWVTAGGANLGGPGRMALLRAVHEHGSITRAARAFGMSYKAAWEAVDAMNTLAGEPLVARTTGGRGGGSTQLTPRGLRLVQRYAQIEEVHRRFLARLDDLTLDLEREFSLLDVLNLRTSARNQFLCSVTEVQAAEGEVNERIGLTLPAGARLVATITAPSRQALALRPGVAVVALVKASAVSVLEAGKGAPRRGSAPGTRSPAASPDGHNRLPAAVLAVEPGGGQVQVTLALTGPDPQPTLVAVVPEAHAGALGLAAGTPVRASIDPASVILGVLA